MNKKTKKYINLTLLALFFIGGFFIILNEDNYKNNKRDEWHISEPKEAEQ